jgi:hypothetical protein
VGRGAEFVASLEASFPSTVSTISRTAGKLGLRSDRDSNVARCPVCGLYGLFASLSLLPRETECAELQCLFPPTLFYRPAGADAWRWRAANAITSFADLTTAIQNETAAGKRTDVGGGDGGDQGGEGEETLAGLLCYACVTLIQELRSKKIGGTPTLQMELPGYVALEAREEAERRSRMRREETGRMLRDEGFLLDGADEEG